MKKTVLLLISIFLLGACFRFYRLGDIPVGFHRDEAFLGYNAYSILKTGKDMNGNFLPLHLQSFLYSPAGYSYFSLPFIKLFDLSTFSVRFASAFFGSLTIPLTFLIAKEIFKQYQYKNHLGLLSAFFISISPWHINLSRTATENTVAVFFISFGVLLYLFWRRRVNSYLLFGSFLSFGLALLIYQAPRAFLPLFIPLLLFLLPKQNTKIFFTIIALLLLTVIVPLSMILSSKELSLRIRTLSIFETHQTNLVIDEASREDGVSGAPVIFTRVFHNKPFNYSLQFLQNYFKHFSYDFLFTDQGLPDRYRIPQVGVLYLFDLPFLLFGVLHLLKRAKREEGLLIGWILFAPIGSALTFDDVPNLQRTLLAFPAIPILTAFGFLSIFSSLRRKSQLFSFVVSLITILAVYNILFYLHQYYIHAPRYRPWYRNDGYKELVSKVNSFLPQYKKAIITNRESAPTIFFLFFNSYDPSFFQAQTSSTILSDFDRISFDKYEFSEKECPLENIEEDGKIHLAGDKSTLYVNSSLCKVPNGAKELATIKRGDGSLVFRVLTVD